MKIYADSGSGNCLKVRYTADHLGLPYQWIEIDIMRKQTRSEAFLSMNPQGQVPLLELDDGRHLAQSNAIIRYLARGSALLPDDAFAQAKVDEWLFWEQYSHEPYIAVCRFHMLYLGQDRSTRDPLRVERGEAALDLLERLLAGRSWITNSRFTIADISLLAYTRLAHEGGFDLESRPAVRAWITRCEQQLGLA